ncbi:type VII secretion-associated serine protease mycosin [Streptomyces sp. T-3]|nr:type VII secretion-associated serine protease mycosin [Streptomyces sp. T-3]
MTGVMALTGALLLTSAPTALADDVRDRQWALRAFDVEKVWTASQGQGVTVAVIDTGVDSSHPDLTGQVLPGKDFSGAGDAHGDEAGHGTGMAAVIAGHGHGASKSDGVMGLAPKAKILPVRASKAGKDMDTVAWTKGVRYAVDQGAKVINLSFNDAQAYPGSKAAKAIQYAQQRDVVVVSGTGNDGEGEVNYPAALPGVVAVGAIDENLEIWDDSNYGNGVTLTAPGVKILSADPAASSGYSIADGTSDATAYVSALAALVRSKYPDLTAGQVINRLVKSATFGNHDIKKSPDEKYGYGMIRAYKTLTDDIPAGPKQGPLAQAPSDTSSKSGTAPEGNDPTKPQAEEKSDSSSLPLIIGGIAAVVVIGGIIFAVMRSRNNRGNGGPGAGGPGGPGGQGYPPHQQQPYPTAPPAQQYPVPPGQSPQQRTQNPYGQ